jgi:hypothetical protein
VLFVESEASSVEDLSVSTPSGRVLLLKLGSEEGDASPDESGEEAFMPSGVGVFGRERVVVMGLSEGDRGDQDVENVRARA